MPGTVSLHRLHEILQVVMGWESYHLYEFTIANIHYSEPFDDWDPDAMADAHRFWLTDVVPGEGGKFHYVYDFGDGWEHEVKVEKVLSAEPGLRLPVCVAGRRACPPEDCGGDWGYAHLLEVLQDPQHEEYEYLLEWVGGPFDPEAFDLGEINRMLEGF